MQEIQAFILIGGESRRMGSDKALLKLAGRTFVEIITGELRRAGFIEINLIGETESGELTEIAVKNELKILPDIEFQIEKSVRASIIGLYSALKYSESEWTFVIACDLPLINAEFIESLKAEIANDIEAVIPVQPDGRYQPFCAFYKRDKALTAVEEILKSKNWKMTNLLRQLNAKYIEFTPETAAPLFNLNTPDDLKIAIALASGGPA